ncbi:hypothetical protein FPV67DRAFT_1081603 [Lyophyllum atratum]|nr:hypothetical protein FPV67DRAFT_1081603 [Lyophyllum atratum]
MQGSVGTRGVRGTEVDGKGRGVRELEVDEELEVAEDARRLEAAALQDLAPQPTRALSPLHVPERELRLQEDACHVISPDRYECPARASLSPSLKTHLWQESENGQVNPDAIASDHQPSLSPARRSASPAEALPEPEPMPESTSVLSTRSTPPPSMASLLPARAETARETTPEEKDVEKMAIVVNRDVSTRDDAMYSPLSPSPAPRSPSPSVPPPNSTLASTSSPSPSPALSTHPLPSTSPSALRRNPVPTSTLGKPLPPTSTDSPSASFARLSLVTPVVSQLRSSISGARSGSLRIRWSRRSSCEVLFGGS